MTQSEKSQASVDQLTPLDREFYVRDAVTVARELLNCILITELADGITAGRITETEAYTQDDAASHSFCGVTRRNSVMFGPAGFAYVYFTYGMHYCFNTVTGPEGQGEAALIRSVEPIAGLELIERRRGLSEGRLMHERDSPQFIGACKAACAGPAKLCNALGINADLNGVDLTSRASIWISAADVSGSWSASASTRIGITRDAHLLRRFVITGDRYTSRSVIDN